jgi:hypothetical protein
MNRRPRDGVSIEELKDFVPEMRPFQAKVFMVTCTMHVPRSATIFDVNSEGAQSPTP